MKGDLLSKLTMGVGVAALAFLVLWVALVPRRVVDRQGAGPIGPMPDPDAPQLPANTQWIDLSLASPARADEPPPQPGSASPWPALYGPNNDSISSETAVDLRWPLEGPKEQFRIPLGTGYSAASIAEGKLVVFHRQRDEEIVEALEPETGKSIWRFAYPTQYEDRYGYNNGPRCTPLLANGFVYTYGAEGELCCLELATGNKIWARSLNKEYQVEQGFFGVGASPILERDRLLINLGAEDRKAGIVAIDIRTGKTLWEATSDGASYSTPRAATLHGRRIVFVFTKAGLVAIEPGDGKVLWSIPFRSKVFESVNASPPVIEGDLVLVSATYNTGTLVVRVKPDGSFEEVWRDRKALESHFSNFAVKDGYVYGFTGRNENGSAFCCVEIATGTVKWARPSILGRGSLLQIRDRLLLWGERGHLACVEVSPQAPTIQSSTNRSLLDGHTWAPPALSNGLLYLRGDDALLCLNLRPAAP